MIFIVLEVVPVEPAFKSLSVTPMVGNITFAGTFLFLRKGEQR
jgi:hypothetical protein